LMSRLPNKKFKVSARLPVPCIKDGKGVDSKKKPVVGGKAVAYTTMSRNPKIVRDTRFRGAVDLLRNNVVSSVDDGSESYDADALAFAQSMMSLNTIYVIRLTHVTSDLSSNGSGVLTGYQNADPSGGSGATWTSPDWSACASLFLEVRMKHFTVHLGSQYLAGNNYGTIVVSGGLINLSSSPGSYDSVFDNAGSKVHNIYNSTPNPITHSIEGKTLNWAACATPNPGAYAGVPGFVQWYANNLSNSQVYLKCIVEGVYEFRSRG
jgi:hypothetical protein